MKEAIMPEDKDKNIRDNNGKTKTYNEEAGTRDDISQNLVPDDAQSDSDDTDSSDEN